METNRYWHGTSKLFEEFDRRFLKETNNHAAPYGFCFSSSPDVALEHSQGKFLYEVAIDVPQGRWFRFDERLSQTRAGTKLHERIAQEGVYAVAQDPLGRDVYTNLVRSLKSDLAAIEFLKKEGYCGAVYQSQSVDHLYACWRTSKIEIVKIHFVKNWRQSEPQRFQSLLGWWHKVRAR